MKNPPADPWLPVLGDWLNYARANPRVWSRLTYQQKFDAAVAMIEAPEWNPGARTEAARFIRIHLLWMAEERGRSFCKECQRPIEFSPRGRHKEFCDRKCGDRYRARHTKWKNGARRSWRKDLAKKGWPDLLLDPKPIMGNISSRGIDSASERMAPAFLDYEDEQRMNAAAGRDVERKQNHDDEARFERDRKRLQKKIEKSSSDEA